MRKLTSVILAACLLPVAAAAQEAATSAPGGTVRVLDKLNGSVTDLELTNGQSATVGRLVVTLGECRFPTDNPMGDAFQMITLQFEGNLEPVFMGWMIASSPAVSAFDNARYDVWPLSCITS
ncbi:DUF2155 domain-containing protein [Ketogulonicigenium vulgare]|uniref:DUF2155 domain-containing protein n=1 Tax=Ketogulonicigenium vulgare (strain WSH-001) TaxID=759362 RepID=F9Y7D0_KETVW|nr:DUF2155 domain-containing protein [Ketogulonicigenium vulgare]ADO42871.1 conserved hypothetical protein [Ketogulonicigenium vulgare Y25]AEM41058.1 hypothetical protein KVU_1218 [Ketogulonicigenium vulgare WSH-001]ALJ81204.1 hypothetical protein KVH_08445 [Ketogulonicigenium vulgare]AOZ54784.1 hypothetical protein KVC_1771 [Ketogulonicigenium vulgare]